MADGAGLGNFAACRLHLYIEELPSLPLNGAHHQNTYLGRLLVYDFSRPHISRPKETKKGIGQRGMGGIIYDSGTDTTSHRTLLQQ